MVGTLLELSGVALTVPLVVGILAVLSASRWRIGDLSLLGLALALGLGLSYILDNMFYDDNGSATDQAVPLVLIPSLALLLWVLARTRVLPRSTRLCAVGSAGLATGALVCALASGDLAFRVLGVPAAALLAVALAGTGGWLLAR